MILITTALMIEAQPLKAAFGLTAVNGQPYPMFQNDDMVLIVTGTGAQKAAAATGWALGRIKDLRIAINMGFAGAPEKVAEINRWYCIHSIRDESSGRLHIPDRLWKVPFMEKALLTTGKPVFRETAFDGLVDMEGSGFYEAARQVLSPDKIWVFKWVSDHLKEKIDPNDTGKRFSSSIQELIPIIENIGKQDIITVSEDTAMISEIRKKIRLTETQGQFLRKWVDGFLKRGGSENSLLKVLPDKVPANKQENNRKFEELKNVLKG